MKKIFYKKKSKKLADSRFLPSLHSPKNGKKSGIIHIKCTKNNTIYTLTDRRGNTYGWISAGSVGYRHSRKTSGPASQKSGKEILNLTKKHGFHSILLKVKGLTRRKKGFIRSLLSKRASPVRKQQQSPIFFEKIINSQSIPFNGCRSPLQRRK